MLRKIRESRKLLANAFYIVFAYFYIICSGFAATADGGADASGGMPWEGPLQKVMDSITGPVAKILGVIVIVLAGFALAFGEVGSGVKRLLQVVLGLAIAFSAASIVGGLFMGGATGVIF